MIVEDFTMGGKGIDCGGCIDRDGWKKRGDGDSG